MKCEECQTLLEDYVDGALGEKAGALVDSHITTCSGCAQFREQLIHEQSIYANYERDVEVTPMLWSSIEARIKRDGAAQPAHRVGQRVRWLSRLREQVLGMFAAPRLSPALAFALVVVAIAVTVLVMTRMNSRRDVQVAGNNSNAPGDTVPSPNGNPTPAPAPAPAPDIVTPRSNVATVSPAPPRIVKANDVRKTLATNVSTPAQLVREAEQKYLTAIAMLSRDVNRKRSQLDPVMLARFDSALSDIDRTIKDTRRVVRENPEDPIALQYLLAAYSKKVDVLRGMSASTD